MNLVSRAISKMQKNVHYHYCENYKGNTVPFFRRNFSTFISRKIRSKLSITRSKSNKTSSQKLEKSLSAPQYSLIKIVILLCKPCFSRFYSESLKEPYFKAHLQLSPWAGAFSLAKSSAHARRDTVRFHYSGLLFYQRFFYGQKGSKVYYF